MVTSRAHNGLLLDRYALGEPLGRGGMGVVWLAQDTVLQRPVAIKEVEFPAGLPAAEAESLRARVLREARAAGRLNHPNVTTIYDVVHDDGRAWIVMEYVDAPTLSEVVTRDGPLDVAGVAAVGLEILDALEAAHGAGIIHRDVKPSNVMVPAEGPVKLADFGVAAVQGDPKITLTGLIIGSPSYMAPEQATEGTSTAATDLWGLGTTLYFAVEGRPAFERGSAIATLAAVTHDAPRLMERAGPLEPVILGLLRRSPEERLTAGELRVLLGELIATAQPSTTAATGRLVPSAAPVEDLWIDEVEDTPAIPTPATPTAVAHGRRSAWPVLLGVLGLLLLAGVLAAGVLRAPDEPGTREDGAAGRQDRGSDDEATGTDAAGEGSGDSAGTPAAAAQPGGAATAAPAPEGWATFAIGDTGATVAHPADWQPVQRSATATDLTDPSGGRYLRVDSTDSPGDDAVAAWQEMSASFAQRKEGYQEVQIVPVDFRGHEAALWEYTYTEGGADLHAYNLAVVAGGRGYALNFQTREELWAASQPLWEQFQATFSPALD